MKKNIDPNRPYNRDAINKVFEKVKAEMHQEALIRGKKKYGKEIASYKDGYSGKELKGGELYEYDHARSAEEVFNKYKATHTDDEIAKIVNHRSNIIVTHRDINRYKGKYRFEEKLKNDQKVIELGIDRKLTIKALKIADLRMMQTSLIISGGFFNMAKATLVPLKLLPVALKYIGIPLTAILILVFLFMFFGKFNFENKVQATNLQKANSVEKIEKVIPNNKQSLLFNNSLDKITESVCKINNYQESVKSLTIPVIGVLFNKNSDFISEKGNELLKEFISDFKKIEVPVYIQINAYTCDMGTDSYNKTLSRKRAVSVKNKLIALGIGQVKILIKGFGEEYFVSSDIRENDLILNRRANILIFEKE